MTEETADESRVRLGSVATALMVAAVTPATKRKNRSVAEVKIANLRKRTAAVAGFSEDSRLMNQFKQLEAIDLNGLTIKGSLALFMGNRNLKELNLRGCKRIVGSFEVLMECTQLQALSLRGCRNVSGDLIAFRHHKDLQFLALSGTKTVGSVQSLSSCPKLKQLYLSGWEVTGTLKDLHKLQQLNVLDLRETSVTGSLGHAGSIKSLQRLTLVRNPQIYGDLMDFKAAFHLRHLHLQAYWHQFACPRQDLSGWILGMKQPIAQQLSWCQLELSTEDWTRHFFVPCCCQPRGRATYKHNRKVMRVKPETTPEGIIRVVPPPAIA